MSTHMKMDIFFSVLYVKQTKVQILIKMWFRGLSYKI